MQPKATQQILFVGTKLNDSLRRTLTERGFAVSVDKSGAGALDQLTISPFDLVVIDLLSTPGVLDFIKQIRSIATFKSLSIVAVGEWGTGQPSLALSAGADAYVPAPINFTRLLESIARLPKRAVAAATSK
jgi:DNA-binding response OmpR family regulator